MIKTYVCNLLGMSVLYDTTRNKAKLIIVLDSKNTKISISVRAATKLLNELPFEELK